MSDFFKSRGFKVLVATFVLLFGMLISSFLRNGVAGTVDGLVGVFVTPIKSVTSAVGEFFSDIGDGFQSKKELRDKIAELEKQNAELLSQIADYNDTKRENEQLKELVNLQEKNPEMEFVSSSVNSKGNDPYSHTLGLDKGSVHGIAVGDPVITKDSFLIGYVSKVGVTWCTVTTILDVTSNVGVSLSSSREAGVLESDADLSKKGLCRVSYLPKGSSVARNELVLTSGLSGYYPEGLIVGQVTEVGLAENGLSAYATVKPSADTERVKDVFVITSFAGQGESGEGSGK